MKLRIIAAGLATLGLVSIAGCHTDMWTQPKMRPFQESDFFADGQSSRPLVAGTVARHTDAAGNDEMRVGSPFYTGIDPQSKKLLDTLPAQFANEPLKVTLHRGQERFNIYCSPCHGRIGDGHGMIAQRGLTLRKPVGNYHTARLRRMPLGHFYDVITNGFGVMYSYSSRVDPDDRWRIAAYIRVLQLSQNSKQTDVPADQQADLDTYAYQPAIVSPTNVQPASPGGEVPTNNASRPVTR